MRLNMKKLIVSLFALLFAFSAYASDKTAGIEFPASYNTGSHELLLNGAGLRKKFVIKVYAGALYLPAQESDAAKVLDADTPAAIRMVMIYDNISAEKMRESWLEGFEANTADLAPLKDRINELTGWFTEAARKGDIYDIVYEPENGTSLIIKGENKGTIQGADFRKALFAVWLGDKPADKGLKENMLGK